VVRIGPDGVELTGRILHITESMLDLSQPVTYTCIAQQQRQRRTYRDASETRKVQSSVTFTVGQ